MYKKYRAPIRAFDRLDKVPLLVIGPHFGDVKPLQIYQDIPTPEV